MKKQVKNKTLILMLLLVSTISYANMPCLYAYNGCVRQVTKTRTDCLDGFWASVFLWVSVECEIEWEDNIDGCGNTYVACVEGG